MILTKKERGIIYEIMARVYSCVKDRKGEAYSKELRSLCEELGVDHSQVEFSMRHGICALLVDFEYMKNLQPKLLEKITDGYMDIEHFPELIAQKPDPYNMPHDEYWWARGLIAPRLEVIMKAIEMLNQKPTK